MGRPSRVSVSTRLNSLLAGGWPSSTTAWIPCRKLSPALREAASVIRGIGDLLVDGIQTSGAPSTR